MSKIKENHAYIVAARTDGFGARMCALLNAMVISKLTGLEFRFAWCAPENAPFMSENNKNLNDNQVLIPFANLPLKEQCFSAEFIEKYGLDDSYIGNVEQFLNPLYPAKSLEDYTKKPYPESFGRYCEGNYLQFPDLEDSKYSALLIECFKEISFTPRVQSIIESAHAKSKGLEFVAVHIRSGDIVYSDSFAPIVVRQTALNVFLALEIIKRERKEGWDIVLFSDDLNVVKTMKEYFNNTEGGRVFGIDDFFERSKFLGYEQIFFEILFMSQAKMIVNGGSSGFSSLAMRLSGLRNHKTPDDYLSQEEKVRILEHSLQENIFHPAHRSFSCMQLILAGLESKKELGYFKECAKIALENYPTNFYRVLAVYFCLLSQDYQESNRILEQAYTNNADAFLKTLLDSFLYKTFEGSLLEYVRIYDRNYPYLMYFAFRIGIAVFNLKQEERMRMIGANEALAFFQNYFHLADFLLKIQESGKFREIAPILQRMEIQVVGAYCNAVQNLRGEVEMLKKQVAKLLAGGGG